VTRLCCPPGRVGEIWVAGASVAQGYWNSPEATADTFRARLADSGEGPFLRTGDLGFIHDEQLFVTGRLKDLIIIRGSNHAPQDIERTAGASHPALRPDCGIAFTIEEGGDPQLVIVHEVRREHSSVDREEVASAIRKAVAEEHELAVHAVVLVKAGTVPKTSSGKLQRHACRDQYRGGTLGQAWESVRPVGDLTRPGDAGTADVNPAALELLRRLDAASPGNRRQVLAAYLDEQARLALRLDPQIPLDPRRPLSELGLDSLMATELCSRLSSAAGQELPATVLFDYPTIEGLAGYLASEVLNLTPGGATNDHDPAADNASSAPGEGARDSRAADIAQLSDEEVEAVLAEELAVVQALLSKDQS
jgi:acyl carrier protein